ncbi:hypothetical protein Tco_0882666 [Tanacetum coccineum]
MVIIVPDEGINVEALQTKYPIIGWEVYSEDTMQFWKIIRVGNYTEVYQVFEDMLKNFDRDDLIKLWSLVQERYNSSRLTEDKEIELWVELKMLFEPNAENLLELQKYMHDPLKWWLYDMCSVHHVSTEKGQDIFMLVKKDYLLTKGLATLMLWAHDKEGTKADVSAPDCSANDWSAPESHMQSISTVKQPSFLFTC